MSQPLVGLVASIFGAVFIGYCIYFDRKRRSDPNFRRDLRRRRQLAAEERNAEQKQRDAFMEEIATGQELLMTGELDSGVEHLAKGVLISNRPIQVLTALQQGLPRELFVVLLRRIQSLQVAAGILPDLTGHNLHRTG